MEKGNNSLHVKLHAILLLASLVILDLIKVNKHIANSKHREEINIPT